ncbi:competence protein CoiA [Alkalicoccus daliensis]|uniref:Competence protein CoiA-like family, contains a predicted nuclease domain n=1 Tax=Alkalicoccus daliensis TaxID=745820 RepID=A0A1G9ZFD3_9BACI|nr:competence protein CoiA family protein [Alkalicoccus daliensis]SDN20059.1 Competence protein CoiA-like family, contains a predicted nuclease domain [Alkalicoccus daliensis]
MFTAISPSGKLIHVTSAGNEFIPPNPISEKKQYTCPVCRKEVFTRGGKGKVRKHFAHRHNSSCLRINETEEHALAKTVLCTWLETYGYKPYVEKVIPEADGQRADILVYMGGEKVILEIQHSPLPEMEFVKRQFNYLKAGYTVIWLGIKNYTKKVNTGKITNLESLRLCTSPFQHSFSLDLAAGKLLFEYGHTQLQASKYTYETASLPLSDSPVHLLFPEKQPKLSKEFFQVLEKEWKRTSVIKRKHPKPDLTEAEKSVIIYYWKNQLNLNYFPALCFLPVPYTAGIKAGAEVWQSWLLFNFVQRGHNIIVSEVLKEMIRSAVFPVYVQSSHANNVMRAAIKEYLILLSSTGAVRHTYPGVFEVLQPLTIKKTLGTLYADDDWIRKKFINYFECKNN